MERRYGAVEPVSRRKGADETYAGISGPVGMYSLSLLPTYYVLLNHALRVSLSTLHLCTRQCFLYFIYFWFGDVIRYVVGPRTLHFSYEPSSSFVRAHYSSVVEMSIILGYCITFSVYTFCVPYYVICVYVLYVCWAI